MMFQKTSPGGLMIRKINLPSAQYRAEFKSKYDEKKRTVEVRWSAGGAKVLRQPFFGESYYEELSIQPGHVRMGRLESGTAPVLDSHGFSSRKGVDNVLGVVSRAWLEGKDGMAELRFSDRDDVKPVLQDISDGILSNVSIGYRVFKYQRQPMAEGEETPTYLAVDWEPYEISMVAAGADPDAGRRNLETSECELEIPGEGLKGGQRQMGKEGKTEVDNPSPAPAIDKEQVRAEAVQAERSRVSEIQKISAKHKLGESFVQRMTEEGHSLEKVREFALTALAEAAEKGAPETRNQVTVVAGQDESEKWRDGASQAILVRAGLSGLHQQFYKKPVEAGEYRGMSLVDMARESLERSGVKTRGMDKMSMVGKALVFRGGMVPQGSSDFAVLLENTMHKVLQASYGITPDTWSKWCGITSVSDFRPHPQYRLGSFSKLDKLQENGEFKFKVIPDGEKSSISAETFGNIVGLSRQAIVNDDLGAFNQIATQLGRAAALSVESDVYALLESNPTVGSAALFHVDHANLGTGAAPTVASIEEARQLMAAQKDPSGNDYLDLRPKYFVSSLFYGGTARVINQSQYDNDGSAFQKPNKVVGLFSEVIDTPRLTGDSNAWYVFADPAIAPTIMVAFLDGQRAPVLETKEAFSMDGVKWKVRQDYGISAHDYRGAVKNVGPS